MKIRDLQRRVGDTLVSIWPPSWASSYGPGDRFAVGEVGVLKTVRQIGQIENRLSLTIEYDGREHLGVLEWTPPPTLDTVGKVLKASIGMPIRAVGTLDV